jgi:putative FmdB family regulatory protein
MPIYEYQCTACGHSLEAIQKMSEAPLTECPKCHDASLQKLVSAAGFQLKGTGWYATDFRNKGKPEASKPATDTAKTETKTDSGSSTATATTTSTDSSSKADKT